MSLLERFETEWPVIQQAWLTLAIMAAGLIGTTWVVARGFYREQIENAKTQKATAESRAALKEAEAMDYKRKLDGASPDEAARRLANLEKLVGHLRPRELTDRQKLAITQALAGHLDYRIEISYAMGDRVCEEYAEELAQLFVSCRWPIAKNAVVAPWARNFPGLAVIHRPGDGSPALLALFSGLQNAGIAFARLPDPIDDNYVCRLSVGPIGSPLAPTTPAVWGP